MEHYGFGRALWQPPLHSEMKPGHVGYFDDNRSWTPLAVVTDPECDNDIPGLKAMTSNIKPRPVEERTWKEPLKSSNVSEIGPSVELGAACVSFLSSSASSSRWKGSWSARRSFCFFEIEE
jgi:hypothetical protein